MEYGGQAHSKGGVKSGLRKSMTKKPEGLHQNARRVTAVLDALAHHATEGLRLIDVSRETGLGKGTLHRIMAGLLDCGLAEQDERTGRYFIGLKIMNWAAAGRRRFGLAEQMKPALEAICEKSEDTVYLAVRQGDEAVYIDRREGAYPLKALPVEVGARRPLGIGAAPLAMLAFQSDEEVKRILQTYARERRAFPVDDTKLEALIKRARKLGYSLHEGEVLPGMVAIGVPILGGDGVPIAAVSVAAGAPRLAGSRRAEIAALLREEIAKRQVHP